MSAAKTCGRTSETSPTNRTPLCLANSRTAGDGRRPTISSNAPENSCKINGITVSQMNDLRAKMAEAGATVKVAKNRLAMLALAGTDAEGIKGLFKK